MKKNVISSCINRSDLSDAEKRILRHIIGLLGIGSTELYARVSGLAKECRVSDRTVQRAIRRLEGAGVLVLVREQMSGRLPRVYSVVPAAILSLSALSTKADQTSSGDMVSPPNALGDNVTAQCHRMEYSSATAKSLKTPAKEDTHQNLPAVKLKFARFCDADREWACRQVNLLVGRDVE